VSSLPGRGEKLTDADGFLSKVWHAYLAAIGSGQREVVTIREQVVTKQDSSPALDDITGLTTLGLLIRRSTGEIVTRLLAVGDGLDVDEPNGNEGNPTLALAPLADTTVGAALVKITREGGALYFTDERAQDAVAAMIAAGSHVGISWSYDDAGNALSATVSGGITRTIATVSTNTTAGVGGDFFYFVTGTTTLSLPAAAGNTGVYTVKNIGGGTVTVDTVGSETIDGAASQSFSYPDALTLVSDGTNWWIV
jgi:hypothetical protein